MRFFFFFQAQLSEKPDTSDEHPAGLQSIPDLPEMAAVATHVEVPPEETPAHLLGAAAHPPAEAKQEILCTSDNPLPDLSKMEPTAAHAEVDLEGIPVHMLELDAIRKGTPIGRGGMSPVFKGKYGPMPVALKQAIDSVQMLINEAATITNIHHPNVIQVFGIWKNAEQEVFMVYAIVGICLVDTVLELQT